ncbi:MAG: bifunctional diaminohydroxyphosphoribosylaminopyrimidine deaminase/5-amino-6-(5-phosphoribosylamino)uracil reductase RibD [Clostridiaceae bacterium]|nr:bifunctional diaminohydroxyphosphoribosylaminopyrimidine deaminase/5-amino-6-(5-phosphoribosylamino)uracil reductase RibD [Clostridiaceae bacterium]
MVDTQYMKQAIKIAKKGCGWTNPNPMVGAVIVKDNEVIGEGYHERWGGLHAERNALANCTKSPEGATLYVTLEPCCHYGRTPPCTEAIIESGISRVVVGSLDPNPLVAGKGIEILRKSGIDVVEGVLKKECDEVNEVFLHYIKNKDPYVVMKYAMTMDGKIATYNGKSKWITGEEARKKVQEDRNRYSAIMVGVNTIIKDDSRLTCRIANGKNPIRIICDTNLRTPLDSNVVVTSKEVETIIATCSNDDRKQQYIDSGCKILRVDKKNGYVNLKSLVKKLGELNIDSILLEGGATLNASALEAQIVNKVQTYIAPKVFGGEKAKSPIGGIGVSAPIDAYKLKPLKFYHLGEDILIESEVVY